MRLTLDSNVLIYSVSDDPVRSPVARRIAEGVIGIDLALTNHALGEFVYIVRKKYHAALQVALDLVDAWSLVFPVALTHTAHLVAAAQLAERHKLQFWDGVILTVAAEAGVDLILTEDLQDGATVAGVRILNPFAPANAALLDRLLTPVPRTG